MKKSTKNLVGCGMVFAVSLVAANVVTGKLVDTGIQLAGSNVLIPGAALLYAVTFLMTDVVGEIWGKKEANMLVKLGFVSQVFASIAFWLTQYLPTNDPSMQEAYVKLLGQNAIFVTGSLIAYLLSQTWDVWVFHKIRNAYAKKHGETAKGRWIWNNASTMTSQIIDTVIFIGIAFGIGQGWLFDSNMIGVLGRMMVGQYCVKFLLALLDTPFFYLMTNTKE